MTVTSPTARIAVADIASGDRFVHAGRLVWTADADAITDEGGTRLIVMHADGGLETRRWDDPAHLLTIAPPATA